MGDKTGIAWTDATWNPVTGCSKVSPGCAHCYAETQTERYAGRPGWPATFLPWTPENADVNVVLHPDRLDAPLHWREPRRVFVNSMSDLFHEQVPDEFIDRVFAVMALTPWHTYQILTKRPERMLAYLNEIERRPDMPERLWPTRGSKVLWAAQSAMDTMDYELSRRMPPNSYPTGDEMEWPLPNVWMGVSVENQHWADERIPLLLQTPAAVRFISAEPLLGPVDVAWAFDPLWNCDRIVRSSIAAGMFNSDQASTFRKPTLDWVIVGGESGPGHRALDLAWVQSIRDQCRAAGVAYFGKQRCGLRSGLPLPDDLGDREYP